jgi:hypothetical protein
MPGYSTRPLDAGTWPDFAALVAAHNGVWGGCWCMAFHPEGVGRGRSPAQNSPSARANLLAASRKRYSRQK